MGRRGESHFKRKYNKMLFIFNSKSIIIYLGQSIYIIGKECFR